MRVHILAKELNVLSKVIVQKCKAEGIDSVKNHMSTLSAGLHATIREWFSDGSHDTTIETTQRIDLGKVRLKPAREKESASPATKLVEVGKEAVDLAVAAVAPPGVSAEAVDDTAAAGGAAVATAEAPAVTVERKPDEEETFADAAAPGPSAVPAEVDAGKEPPGEQLEAVGAPAEIPEAPAQAPDAAPQAPPAKPEPVTPAGPQNIPAKAKLQGPRVVRYEAPEHYPTAPRRRPAEQPQKAEPAPGAPPVSTSPSKPLDRGLARRKVRVGARQTAGRLAEAGERMAEWRDQDLAERRARLAGATGRRIRRRATHGGGPMVHAVPAGPKTQAVVHEPVRMKEFCSATGLNFLQCLRVLRDEHGMLGNVNMTLAIETAELLAMHFGIELTVIASKTLLDEVQEEFAQRNREHLERRPPVVTMLGHVDHGKTSLLDAVRATRVVAGEDGGITQHLGAYHIDTPQGAVTFLDTPGHKAFTEMRARGAHLTDVVVLVVAADDGVMPQTIEAINHAHAAGVPIVVALNKIDLGDEHKLKIYGQLTEHGLTPSGDWGGEIDVIPTSATTGIGIQDLVEHLAHLSSLLDLQADPTLPGTGTVIEAETKPGVGPVVRLLVQEGTLRTGDCVVCGPAFGKVRALLDDDGRRIKEAGPSLPVEVWGLDEVPAAGDKLYSVENLQRAKDVAAETKQTRIEKSRLRSRKIKTLEEIVLQRDTEDVPELNIVIKADVDGSVSALRQALGELPTDDVRLAIRHGGVGAVNDGDVLLAATCGGIVIAFRVEAPVRVRRLAEQNGVEIRSYRVIYDVHDDVKKALEGLLEPEEHFEPRGSAEVRELFRLSGKIGVVAGSFVTDGIVDRKHLAKIVRDGVVVREGCEFASLRRFKDDVRKVRAGLECGIRLEGFDDLHVGDIIESYEVVKVPRTL
jgi:translation initiation factor IF-2